LFECLTQLPQVPNVFLLCFGIYQHIVNEQGGVTS
jgi:hypothetical protein